MHSPETEPTQCQEHGIAVDHGVGLFTGQRTAEPFRDARVGVQLGERGAVVVGPLAKFQTLGDEPWRSHVDNTIEAPSLVGGTTPKLCR